MGLVSGDWRMRHILANNRRRFVYDGCFCRCHCQTHLICLSILTQNINIFICLLSFTITIKLFSSHLFIWNFKFSLSSAKFWVEFFFRSRDNIAILILWRTCLYSSVVWLINDSSRRRWWREKKVWKSLNTYIYVCLRNSKCHKKQLQHCCFVCFARVFVMRFTDSTVPLFTVCFFFSSSNIMREMRKMQFVVMTTHWCLINSKRNQKNTYNVSEWSLHDRYATAWQQWSWLWSVNSNDIFDVPQRKQQQQTDTI